MIFCKFCALWIAFCGTNINATLFILNHPFVIGLISEHEINAFVLVIMCFKSNHSYQQDYLELKKKIKLISEHSCNFESLMTQCNMYIKLISNRMIFTYS